MSVAVKIRDTITSDGKRFEKMLKELADKEVRIGFQRGENTDEDGVDICDIAAFNELGTANSPSRPFLRKSVDENESAINAFLKDVKKDICDGVPAEQILKKIGLFQQDLIQEKITEGQFTPNAPATIKKKGSDKPLIDTGRMRQSVNYVIQKKGGSGD